jgi:hypothetical protein
VRAAREADEAAVFMGNVAPSCLWHYSRTSWEALPLFVM